MRPNTAYRSYRRNSAREQKTLRNWHRMNLWMKANAEANLAGRAKQCEDARACGQMAVEEFAMRYATLPLGTAIRQALLAYWATQKPTRVVWRIMKELRHEIT